MGPGQYNVEKTLAGSSGFSFSRAKSTRTKLEKPVIRECPGVGDYDISGEMGYIPKYLFRG